MMAICIEASHARGLGHLFKAINLSRTLREKGAPFIILVNDDPVAAELLTGQQLDFRTVSLAESSPDWESPIIRDFGVSCWLNDRLDTGLAHAERVKANGVTLVTVDDRGAGAELADLHFAPLIFSGKSSLKGKKILTGHQFLILNGEIPRHQRLRENLGSIVVTLGGSDTYGVTLRVVNILKGLGKGATVITGPSFRHQEELHDLLDSSFTLKCGVPSLVEEFSRHDLAITGGGVTPFEANASGLPCLVVASEPHEIEIAGHLARLGSSLYAGYRSELDEGVFSRQLDLQAMSLAGLAKVTTRGAEHMYREIAAHG